MNRNKLISLIAIALLCALIFGKELFQGTNLPKLTAWEEELTPDSLIIEKKSATMSFSLKDDKWFMNEAGFEATYSLVDQMVGRLRSMKLYSLISKSKTYARYGLDDDNSIHITLKAGDKTLREIYLGKQSPGSSQSYIRFADSDAIYLAGQMTTRDFTKSVDDLRNKDIVRIPMSAVERLEVSYAGETSALFPVEEELSVDESSEDPAAKELKRVFKFEDDTSLAVEEDAVISMCNRLNPLKAKSFTTAPEEGAEPEISLRVDAYNKSISIQFYPVEDEEKETKEYAVVSSESSDVYLVAENIAKTFMRKRSDLIKK